MKYLFVVMVLAVFIVAPSLSFAAYGGGGSSISSVSVLQRDVCTDGDNSGSYFDGTCGTHESAPVLFTTQAVPTPIPTAIEPEELSAEEAIVLSTKKEAVLKQLTDAGKKQPTLPFKYFIAKIKVDFLMNKWEGYSRAELNHKARILLRKIDKLLASDTLSEKVKAVIQYVYEKTLLLVSLDEK